MLKGSADYLKRNCEPEVNPVNHLYPLKLSLIHEYRTPLPDIEILPEEINFISVRHFRPMVRLVKLHPLLAQSYKCLQALSGFDL